MTDYVRTLNSIGLEDLDQVGGKNASLGEMIRKLSDAGVQVPGGFATTADAYRDFMTQDGLGARINETLSALDVDDVAALAKTASQIRQWVLDTPLQPRLQSEVESAWQTMTRGRGDGFSVAVRSSATAEDLPDASFAGQQETFLNVSGLDNVIARVHEVFASLYNDRAIAYRVHHGFDHAHVALSAGIQRMVRSDLGASGVLFTLDTESGFRDVVFITASWGLGEMVVQGAVNPDEFYVHKQTLASNRPAILRRSLGSKAIRMVYAEPGAKEYVRTEDVPEEQRRQFCLSDEEVHELARQAMTIEDHYGRPMDIEWARDGADGQLYTLQARPETVRSRSDGQVIERYQLKSEGPLLCEGRSIGHRIGSGTSRVIRTIEGIGSVQPGDVLITDMTDPDWEPVMKRAAAIVTNRGGRTCHAAIIARELGVPAVVGCGNATDSIPDGTPVTVSCAAGDTGFVYDGALEFDVQRISMKTMPEIPLKVMMNVANPDRAFDFAQIPHAGIGLARLEFIISQMIGIHPRALLEYDTIPSDIRDEIDNRIAGYAGPVDFYVDKLAEGIATLSAAFSPHPVIVRMSDFKSNEYANLVGGNLYEPREENPMIGWRGASRYVASDFRPCFELECRALKKVRDDMGLTNTWVMVPFVRTVDEGRQVVELLAENGLKRGANELKLIMMCEVPSNALLADQFLEHFDGFSIGSNDLTQLTLGLDRDSELIAHLFDERDDAVKALLSKAITACRESGKYIGICGQGPSDHPDLARWLLDQGIESVSLNPDTVVETWLYLAGKTV